MLRRFITKLTTIGSALVLAGVAMIIPWLDKPWSVGIGIFVILIGIGLWVYQIRKIKTDDSNIPNQLMIRAKEKHFDDIRKAIEEWKNSLAYSVNTTFSNYEFTFPTIFNQDDWSINTSSNRGSLTWYINSNNELSLWFSFEKEITLFPCLKKHLLEPELWESLQGLRESFSNGIKQAHLQSKSIYVAEADTFAYKIVNQLDIALTKQVLIGKCKACPDYQTDDK
jgi:hypothetical protein